MNPAAQYGSHVTLSRYRRTIGFTVLALGVVVGTAGCSDGDDGGEVTGPSTTAATSGVLAPPAARTGTEWYLLYLTSLEDPAAKVQPFTTADRKVFEAVGTVIGEFCGAEPGSSARTGPALVASVVAATGSVLGEATAAAARGPLAANQQLLLDAAEATCATG